ncbi:enoyl-CoA hydratase/isomerase family protein [Rhizomonospora bruguierae]|uniref:enoyl-CoA hydratase/isomerase family protein n=1 Tax=Rhizomonospora bruguierae TaxID=1581705 RepID=UPI001BCC423D|nr:enoyl-CoA hydratase/isomerase family protein [Micromonospora sp. NBRC 107566]
MSADLVLGERRDGFAVVTLNRPEKRNAITIALADRFRAVLADLEDVPVIVLTGAGDRSFSAGMDLNERAEPGTWRKTVGAERGTFWLEAVEVMRRHPAMFIAAVNGFAVGGGLTLVNNSELAIAADTAQFGMPELGFGAFPALAGPSTARRILPKHMAQLMFTAKRVDAETALRWGIVNEVVPAATLMERATELAAGIAARDAVAVAFCKKALREMELMPWSEALDYGTLVSNTVKNIKAARHEGASAS